MTYQETLDYLYQRLPMFQRVGAKAFKKDLGNITALCKALGNPEKGFRSIHIAGTNGKGSVSSMLASILQESGFKVGLYTSPHLRSFTERIRINGEPIAEEAVVKFIERSRDAIERIAPSFFEVTVAMAFDHFQAEKVDFAVIEVGLGGRLDSTNVIEPITGAITNISFDHMGFLGNTLPEIAAEKAGIFKKGVRFVIGEAKEETRPVFEEVAVKSDAKLVFVESFYRIVSKSLSADSQTLTVEKEGSKLIEYKLSLLGEFQSRNALTVLGVVDELRRLGVEIGEGGVQAGFRNVKENTGFRGRLTFLQKSPMVLTDVGHNVAGVTEVLKAIGELDYQDLHMVWGMVNDKDHDRILSMLPQDASYYFVKPNVPRGMDANELAQYAQIKGLIGDVHASVQAGLDAALSKADKTDLIFVGGSTFVVAEVV